MEGATYKFCHLDNAIALEVGNSVTRRSNELLVAAKAGTPPVTTLYSLYE